MNDELVFVSEDGHLAVCIPLYRQGTLVESEIVVRFTQELPMAYMMDIGGDNLTLLSAEIIEDRLELLGEL